VEAVWAVRAELATTLDDVLCRRTRAALLDREATAAAAPRVAGLVGGELGWDPDRQRSEVDRYLAGVEQERAALRSPAGSR
jgi:glycerol-3-phosphate dehydrogenase